METRGLGDRWLTGDAIEGVLFARHDPVTIVYGPNSGESASVLLLMGIRPQPTYLVEFASGGGTIRLRQDELRAAG